MFNRTFWKDRSVEKPNHYIDDDGNEKSWYLEPGNVYEAGTPIGQANLNNQEIGISALFTSVLMLIQRFRLLITQIAGIVADTAGIHTELNGKATTRTFTATIPASQWSASAPYTQTVNVTGVLDTDEPMVDVTLSSTTATAIAQLEAYSYIGKIVAGAGTITITCLETKPTVDIPIRMKVIR